MTRPTGAVTAVILAAGAGRRMGGRPKALLAVDGETCLERVVRTCRGGGVTRLVVVTRTDPPEISRLARSLGAAVVENPDPERGMFSSVRLGIEAALGGPAADGAERANGERPPGGAGTSEGPAGGAGENDAAPPDGILIFPVDHPHVVPSTVAALLSALPVKLAGTWLRPVYDDRGGHPVLVDVGAAAALLARDPGETLRDALRAIGFEPHAVPVDDPGIHANLNRPKDLG